VLSSRVIQVCLYLHSGRIAETIGPQRGLYLPKIQGTKAFCLC